MKHLRQVPIYAALLVVSAIFLFPFYWLLINSVESVEGMTLKPPALFPAELKTTSLKSTMPVVTDGEHEWMLLGKGTGGTNDYLQIDRGKPTQLVKSLAESTLKPVADHKPIAFEKVPIHRKGEQEFAMVAKSVQQGENSFAEAVFAVNDFAKGTFDSTERLTGVEHTEVRHFAAHPDNFTNALKGPEASIGTKSSGFLLYMRNSFFISTMAVLGQILASSLVAFGFSRMWFKGRDFLFILLLATLMVPAQVTLIPLFTIYKSLGWIDTFLPLIVPHFTAGAFNVFLIRQFMLTFPKELDESAAMDGATPFRVYRSIIFPMCAPVLIVVGLFTFVATWQDVVGPLIYLDNPDYRTVSLGLEYFRSPYVDNRPLLMAGAVLAMVPVAVLFLIVQRYIMSGIATTGLK